MTRTGLLNLRSEKLILQIACPETNALDELDDFLRFSDVSSQWLLAGEAGERAFAISNGGNDLFDVLDAAMIRTREPDSIDGWIGHHGRDGFEPAGCAEIEITGEANEVIAVSGVRTPHTKHICVTDAAPSLQMKAGIESTSDKADAKPSVRNRAQQTHLVCGFTLVDITAGVTPRRAFASGGQPFQFGLKTLPRYSTSFQPIALEKNPLAVKSRN